MQTMNTTPLGTAPVRPLGWLVAAVLAGLLVGIFAGPAAGGALAPSRPTARAAAASETPPEHSISVTGSGKVTVVPDMATVRLGVSVTRPTAKAARKVAAEAMTKVVAAIRKLGVEERDIATSLISLSPVYDYQRSTSTIRGYQLQNTVTVTVRNLDTLGDVLDDGITSGATTVDGISFDVADRAAAEAGARQAAVKDAKAKADTLAAGLSVHIVGVASISETVTTPPWYGREAALGVAGDAASTPVLPGTTDVEISVAVSFLLD